MHTYLKELRNIGFVTLGILSASFGLKGFLLSSRFIDGGVTGVSMLLSDVLGVRLAILIPLINFPFLILAYRRIGKTFALKSALAIAGLSACLAFIHFPDVTPDKLLTAVFGGFFIGAGIGLAIRGGAVLDGTEIVALLGSKGSYLLKVGDIILLLNVFIFTAAAKFLGVESALYSILTYFAASKTVDFLLYGIEEYQGILIVSARSDEIRAALLRDLDRGVTVYKGRGGATETEQDLLYCVVTKLEIGKIRSLVDALDENAFVIVQHVADVSGGTLKRRVLH